MITRHTTVASLNRAKVHFNDRPEIDHRQLNTHLKIIRAKRTAPQSCEARHEQSSGGEAADSDFEPPLTSTPLKQNYKANQEGHATPSPVHQATACRTGSNQGDPWSLDQHTECDICGFRGRIANHLRDSADCRKELRSRPNSQFKGSYEVFVVKLKDGLL